MFVLTLGVIFLFPRYFLFGNDTHPLNVSTEKAQKIILSEIFFAPETFIAPLETISIQKAGMTSWLDPTLYVKCSVPDNQLTNILNHQYWSIHNGTLRDPIYDHKRFPWWPSTGINIDFVYSSNSPFSEILIMKPINDYRELYIFTFGSRNKAETGSKFSKEFRDYVNNSR